MSQALLPHPNGEDRDYLTVLLHRCEVPSPGHPESERGRLATLAWLRARLDHLTPAP